MSATNWAICPRCVKRARLAYNERGREIAALYGKVPVEEFDAARDSLADLSADTDPEQHRCLREDYEMFVDEDGLFSAYYHATCNTCGLEHHFDVEQKIEGVS